jgi:hypothetical protein
MTEFFQHLKQPEYVHVLLNPLPVYGTAMGALALLIALFTRSVTAKVVALILVIVGCISVWPVMEYGDAGADRVQAMSNAEGKEWLEAHDHRADKAPYVYYPTLALTVATLVSLWKFPRAATPLAIVTLIGAVTAMCVGGWISQAGGRIRHSEFREDGPLGR